MIQQLTEFWLDKWRGLFEIVLLSVGIYYGYLYFRGSRGAKVLTGQVIGAVGQTGAASGCHLHFEMWSAPGWYTGGKAIDPGPALKLWDAYS